MNNMQALGCNAQGYNFTMRIKILRLRIYKIFTGSKRVVHEKSHTLLFIVLQK
jgi:hypothetical protein